MIDDFFCDKHKIFITSSTFVYENWKRNLIWNDSSDLKLLNSIYEAKTESRMNYDNSEDALSWNVFRYFEKEDKLNELLHIFTGRKEQNSKIYYWSYAPVDKGTWSYLNLGRVTFNEHNTIGSEPDIIIETDHSLYFIEAKFNSPNPKLIDYERLHKYLNGENKWSQNVFKQDLMKIPLKKLYYELIRFWIISTWISHKIQKKFYLLNLVSEKKERLIESRFKKQISDTDMCEFRRVTWEEIYKLINETDFRDNQSKKIKKYLINKSGGYENGRLSKPFSFQRIH